jgi:hypothetical protein
LAPRRLSPLLALAIAIARRSTENYAGTPGLDCALCRGKSRLGRSQNPWELQKLGFTIAERTVARYARHRPERRPGEEWWSFLQNHREVIAAKDFFTVPTVPSACCIASLASRTNVARLCTAM